MNRFLEEAFSMQDEIVSDRRHIHRKPELGFDLPETREYVKAKLRSYGYELMDLGGGVTCTVGTGTNPVILLRADMDALPQTEDSGEPFSSENKGACHSCGHDCHTAMLLGAAKILKVHEKELKGTVKFMFQPAEELLQGSQSMIDAGILENPKVDAAVGFHINTGKCGNYDLHPGTMVFAEEKMMPSADEFIIRVQGKAAHGATAYLGVSALNIASNIVTQLQQMPILETAYNDDIIMSIGSIHSGNASNIIPDTAEIRGNVRAFTQEKREYLKKRIAEIATGVASAWQGTAEISYTVGVAPNVNDRELTQEMKGYLANVAKKIQIIQPVSGSEDFANIGLHVPTFFANLCAGAPEDGYEYSMHNPKMRVDEEALPYGTAAHCQCAYEYLAHHEN
ncbi:MAG: M20 family metallopeptidase [Eubacteriales bacterium]|nr:M20 family metallopeptidase [Eubacteriales bacterium]